MNFLCLDSLMLTLVAVGLRDEEDEDVQVIEPSIKSPKKKTGNQGGKTKQSARKKQNVQTRELSAEPSDEQIEEQQSEGHPVSDNAVEPVQPTNADVTVTKLPRKGKRTAKRKSSAQPKEKQTVDPSGDQQNAKKIVEEQQTEEPSTRRSPRTRKGRSHTDLISRVNSVNIELNPDIVNSVLEIKIESGFKGKIANFFSYKEFPSAYHHVHVAKLMTYFQSHFNTLAEESARTPIPPENENAHRKKPRTEPTTEATPEYHASSSQPQDKGQAPATEEKTEEKDDDDEDEDTEEEDPAQFRLVRRRPGSSKITF
ncbi:uncharacterized protein LOC113782223 [Coffea eugenioides]|uniref:uncharacterized protein LOC113782223 n=1 Tax=Coffea eugenioides TaxID=49369 RepID=UPI000F60B2D1|nr:uncharacterized protein LOC113782223 [Coffea eugenioides]